MKKTAVVILNWNGRQFLEIFLRMVVDRSPEAEVWVADNGSTDDSVAYLRSNFPDVKVLELDSNYGYSGGYNRALDAIEADYYVLLNSDIEVSQGWLGPLTEMMESNPDIAAVQPKILSFAEKGRFEYAGASGGFIDILGYPFCRGRFIGQKTEFDTGQYDDAREIFWATGAAIMVRGDIFKRLGGLDELFFAHMEEIDLCWRMKRAGYRIMAEPASWVYHVGGGTLPIWSPRKTYLNFRNNIAMLYKNLSKPRFAAIYSIRTLTDSLRAFSYLIQMKFKFAKAVMNGHRDFWEMHRKLNRHNELGHGNVSCIYNGSIVLKQVFGKGVFGKMMTIAVLSCIISCSGKQKTDLIEIRTPSLAAEYRIGDDVKFDIIEKEPVDSIKITVSGTAVKDRTCKASHVGKTGYTVTAYKDGRTDVKKGSFLVHTERIPSIIVPEIVREYPHSTESYTQGLVYRDGKMYESIGEYGQSALLETDPATGKTIRRKDVQKKYFAEGLELIDGALYQLTWRENTCIRYSADDFTETGRFSYSGEGWGLATDGKRLFMSDGTSVIKIIDPADFSVKGTIQVMDQRGEVSYLNELEWINGRIWANIYTRNWIAVINPATGEVESYVNCSTLEKSITKETGTDVLNGIAYDSDEDMIYLTGKNWNRMFLVKPAKK